MDAYKKHKETLNKIQKALEQYLEEKRIAFPRFYFLSNDELLEILAKSQDTDALQKNIKKCFEAIYRLKIPEDNQKAITGAYSPEGEELGFQKQVSIKSKSKILTNR